MSKSSFDHALPCIALAELAQVVGGNEGEKRRRAKGMLNANDKKKDAEEAAKKKWENTKVFGEQTNKDIEKFKNGG